MTFLDCVGKEINIGDFVIYVTAGDRHPVLAFGYVESLYEAKESYSGKPSGSFKIKFQKSTPDGRRIMIRVEDVPAHWRADTPQSFIDYDNAPYHSRDTIMTHDEYWNGWEEFYIHATYKNSDKPETTMLGIIETTDPNKPRYNKRMMVTKPDRIP